MANVGKEAVTVRRYAYCRKMLDSDRSVSRVQVI
jgi:hypothetical protein